MLQDPTLKNALFPPAAPPKDYVGTDVPTALTNVAANNLQDYPLMTVALFDSAGTVIASHGAETEKIVEVSKLPAYIDVAPTAEAQFSVTLGGTLTVVKVSTALSNGTRLVAINPLDLGATSFFRQILGTRSRPRWSAAAPPSRTPRSTTRTSATASPQQCFYTPVAFYSLS